MLGRRPDPDAIASREDLRSAMEALRLAAGVTIRQLARDADVQVGTLSGWLTGRHLPNLTQRDVFTRVLGRLEVTGTGELEAWLGAIERLRTSSDGRAARAASPYRGLEPYGEEDSEVFFGRDRATAEVLGRLDGLPGAGIVALVGASGAGKSSLLMGGVVPALRAGDGAAPRVVVTTADAVTDHLAADAAAAGAVVVVDRLEDVLTADAPERRRQLDRLGALGQACRVVVAVRADFYDAAAAEPALVDALRSQQVLLTPMTTDELRAVIVGPATAVGATVEPALVELVLGELRTGTGFAHEAGALPLLSYALLAAWNHAGRNTLTVADYVTVGGIGGAVLQAAERLYTELDAAEREVVRTLFSRLVRVEGDSRPTRRRVGRQELLETGDPATDQLTASVLERFVSARLVTAEGPAVQLSHEALLGAWPRLAEWVGADRAWLELHQRLADAAGIWDRDDRDGSLLWRGPRLATAAESAQVPGRRLNRVEGEFLAASVGAEAAHIRAERRRARRVQRLLVAVAVAAAAAVVAAVAAVDAGRAARTARDQALSREVAIEARQVDSSDPSLAAQLAVAAYRLSPTLQARSALLDIAATDVPSRLVGPSGPEFVATSADGRLVAVARTGGDDVAVLRAGDPLRQVATVAAPAGGKDFAVAVRGDGRLLAVAGTTGTVELVDLSAPAAPRRLGRVAVSSTTVYAVAFDPQGHRLAAAGADGRVHLVDTTDPAHPRVVGALAGPGGSLASLGWLPDGALVAVGAAGAAAVWPGASGPPLALPDAGTGALQGLAVSPDGRTVAAGSLDGQVHVWDLADPAAAREAHAPLPASTSQVDSLAFSPDGATLAVGTADGHLLTYATGSYDPPGRVGLPDPVTGLGFAGGGHELVAADAGGGTMTFAFPLASMSSEPGNIFTVSYADDGRLAVATDGAGADVTLWAATGSARPAARHEVRLPAALGPVAGAAAISPDGRLLAAADKAATVQLFDIADPAHPAALGAPLSGAQPVLEGLAFSPSGSLLVAVDDTGAVVTWDVSDPRRPRALPVRHDAGGQVEVLGVAFDAAGDLLATASTDGAVRLYRVGADGPQRLLATLTGFSNYAYTVGFGPRGRTLYAGSADGTIRRWSLADPGRPAALGQPLAGPSGYVYQLAVSPDGRTLAAASTDHSVWLWDVADRSAPAPLATLDDATDAVFAVTYRPDGRALAAGGSDDTLHVWPADAADARRQICATVATPISRSNWSRYVQGAPYSPPCA